MEPTFPRDRDEKSPRRKWVWRRLATVISIAHNLLLFLLAPVVGIDLNGFKSHILFLIILNLKTLVLVGWGKDL